MKAVIEVVTEDQFRVNCTSTGGRVLNMSVTGPHGVVYPPITVVGTQRWMGDDSYSAYATLRGADDGDIYNCMASNGVSSVTDRIEIGGRLSNMILCNFQKVIILQLSVNQ